MKVIKKGYDPNGKTYSCRCIQCRTVFEFERHEAEYVEDFRDGDFLRIKCPTCKKQCAVTP